MHKHMAAGMVLSILALWPAPSHGQTTVTRDVAFTSHDGHAMTGRLTLLDTPGTHPVMVFVQNAEAFTVDQQTQRSTHAFTSRMSQFGVGRSIRSISPARISVRSGSSFRPNCSSTAVKSKSGRQRLRQQYQPISSG